MGLSNADKKENIQKFLIKNKGLSYVCRHEDKIIGTILCGHDGRRGYIYHMTVAEEHRGRGIGRRLVEISLEGLKSEGINKWHLFVLADNTIVMLFGHQRGGTREKIFLCIQNLFKTMFMLWLKREKTYA